MVNFSYSSIKNFLGLERRVSEEKHLDKKWYLLPDPGENGIGMFNEMSLEMHEEL